jgi:hypothetical protein
MKRIVDALAAAAVFFALPIIAFAQSNSSTGGVSNSVSGGATSYQVQNPLAASSFCGLIQNLLQAALAIGIPIAVLFLVYAGFKFVLAQGNPEKLREARSNFLWTIIGIGIFLGAWLLADLVVNTVNALGMTPGQPNLISCN